MSTAPTQLIADRYRLIEPLGQGGMGRVWRARDEVLHRDVAIKELVPPPGLTDDERRAMRERSLREARAIARLNHVNVVRVFDVLRTDGDPWIVMEYVPSRSLQDVLSTDGPLSPIRVAEIGLGVLAALRAAHRAGVVHRDIKPGNVLLGFGSAPGGAGEGQPSSGGAGAGQGRVVLTDFGLATVPGDPSVTRTGMVLGSPAYIAPERVRDGSTGPAGDLWSLGATLYAAVEGQSPYTRPSAMATLAALATEPPPSPKRAGPLKPVLYGLLRKDPANRIKADEAERLLRRVVSGRSRGQTFFGGIRRLKLRGSGGRDAAAPPLPESVPADPLPAPAAVPPVRHPAPPTQILGQDFSVSRHDDAVARQPDGFGETAPGSGPAVLIDNRRRRRRLIGGLAALVLLGLVAVAVAVPLARDDPAGDGIAPPGAGPVSQPGNSATAGRPPEATPSTGPPSSTTPDGPPPLPAGWRLYHDPTGFTVPVPESWRVSRKKYGPAPDEVRVYFQDLRNGRMLLIDQTNSPKRDPVADWKQQEAARRDGYSGYRRVKIEKVDYWDRAADWEWTYKLNGVRVHVRNRGFVTAPDKAYGMFWRTPEAAWTDNLDEFELIAAGFRPARS